MLTDDVAISQVPFVRDLGIYIDADLSMRTRVQRTQLRQIRRSVTTATFQMFVVALVHSRLDYEMVCWPTSQHI